MFTASVSHQYCPLRDSVSTSSIVSAPVDGMLVVEASASRVNLDELETHLALGMMAVLCEVLLLVCCRLLAGPQEASWVESSYMSRERETLRRYRCVCVCVCLCSWEVCFDQVGGGADIAE